MLWDGNWGWGDGLGRGRKRQRRDPILKRGVMGCCWAKAISEITQVDSDLNWIDKLKTKQEKAFLWSESNVLSNKAQPNW